METNSNFLDAIQEAYKKGYAQAQIDFINKNNESWENGYKQGLLDGSREKKDLYK